MAQSAPTSILYSQALDILSKLKRDYSTNKYQTPDEIATLINKALSKFNELAGSALTQFDEIGLSEIPTSSKINKFWNSAQTDINILQNQIDVLNAAAIQMHNFIKMEILKAKNENQNLHNKLKTLQLYSNSDDSSIIFFGDQFISDDFIDWKYVTNSERALVSPKRLTLNVDSQKLLSASADLTILPGSNGFPGNNQEIKNPNVTTTNLNGELQIVFVGELNRSADLRSISDSNANTWFEFERYQVSKEDKAQANAFNFEYTLTGESPYEYIEQNDEINLATLGTVDWSNPPSFNILKLLLEIDLKSPQVVNLITLLPFGLADNINNPIKIVKVTVSEDKNTWYTLTSENVWVANSIDKKLSAIDAESINLNEASWINNNSSLQIQYIRFEIEQPNPITANIGHVFYTSKNSSFNLSDNGVGSSAADSPSLTDPTGVVLNNGVSISTGGGPITASQTSDLQVRVKGPNPPISDPFFYLNNQTDIINDYIQKKEFFVGKRWVIALRDIAIYSNLYQSKSVIVSKKFDIAGVVDRVAIEADVEIPEIYDQAENWIKFYVSPNNGSNWYQISRIQDDFLDLPEIIAFNDPTPTELREPGVAYYDVAGTVNSLRVKVEITRPDEYQFTTPVLKNYKLKIVKRG